MEIAAICAVCFALGLVIGFEWGDRKKVNAPAPVIPDYDADNPINARGRRGEKVIICGREFTRMN